MMFPFLIIIAGIAAVLHWIIGRIRQRMSRFPPGPFRWPIVGDSSSWALFRDPKNRLESVTKRGKRYGGIFSTKIGAMRPSVFITSYKYFREAVIDHSWEFAGRPQKMWMQDETTDKYTGIIANGVDEPARKMRKFTLVTLRNFGFGKNSMQESILRESSDLNEEFKKMAGIPFDPRTLMAHTASNVISTLTLGRTYKHGNCEAKKDRLMTAIYGDLRILEKTEWRKFDQLCLAFAGDQIMRRVNEEITLAMRQIGTTAIFRMFPLLRFFMPAKPLAVLNEHYRSAKTFFKNVIADHIPSRISGEPRDFIDVWLDKRESQDALDEEFHVKRLENIVIDIFAAGFETTSTTFRWLFAVLLNYPDVQDQIQREIDNAVTTGRQITLEDRDLLPYTEAVIMETLRLYPLIPFSVPHETTDDANIGPYRIPKGTRVFLSLYNILRDPDLWTDPELFQPERFLHDGKLKLPEYFVVFGAGRRSCIGEQLARKELFLIFANILRCFLICQPPDEPLASLEKLARAVIYPHPYNILAKERRS